MRALQPALQGGPLFIAHRGGSGLAPENTLAAFHSAADDWAADMIELDVRATSDGHCVVIHDATVDRTTNGSGDVAAMTLRELRALDAGYRFTRDQGSTFPFRDRGITIPTIDEVLEQLPTMRLTVEVKIGTAQRGLFDAIRRHNAAARVIAAGMHDRDRTQFARYSGAHSASTEQMRRFYVAHRLHLAGVYRLHADVVQAPETHRGRRIITPRMIRELRAQQIPVHIWTVNEIADMERLLEWGVDGLISDRPDRLSTVFQRRGRPPAPIETRPA